MRPRACLLLLTGFAPFGGERTNPSWEVASLARRQGDRRTRRQDGGLPVNCRAAARAIAAAIRALSPARRARARPGAAGARRSRSRRSRSISPSDRASRESDGGASGTAGDCATVPTRTSRACRSRAMLRALERRGIPAAISLSAGVYVCNTVMYATLHALRRARGCRRASSTCHTTRRRRRAIAWRPSMSLELMTAGDRGRRLAAIVRASQVACAIAAQASP